MALRLMRERTLAQRRCSQSLCSIRPRRGDSIFFLDPRHPKAPPRYHPSSGTILRNHPEGYIQPRWHELGLRPICRACKCPGPVFEFLQVRALAYRECRSTVPTYTASPHSPSYQTISTPYRNQPRTAPCTRTALDAHCDAMDGHTQMDLLALTGSMRSCSQLESRKLCTRNNDMVSDTTSDLSMSGEVWSSIRVVYRR